MAVVNRRFLFIICIHYKEINLASSFFFQTTLWAFQISRPLCFGSYSYWNVFAKSGCSELTGHPETCSSWLQGAVEQQRARGSGTLWVQVGFWPKAGLNLISKTRNPEETKAHIKKWKWSGLIGYAPAQGPLPSDRVKCCSPSRLPGLRRAGGICTQAAPRGSSSLVRKHSGFPLPIALHMATWLEWTVCPQNTVRAQGKVLVGLDRWVG